jgi:hypothetical protein
MWVRVVSSPEKDSSLFESVPYTISNPPYTQQKSTAPSNPLVYSKTKTPSRMPTELFIIIIIIIIKFFFFFFFFYNLYTLFCMGCLLKVGGWCLSDDWGRGLLSSVRWVGNGMGYGFEK